MSDAPEYAAPARRTDLTGLPPAGVGVGELDLFYDEDVDYAEKLRASGFVASWSPCQACITVRTVSRRKPGQCRTFGAA
jgi:acetyl esterase/lipase